MKTVQGTMSERGEAFVAAWPKAVARRLGLGVEWTATAMQRAGIITREEEGPLRSAFLRGEAAQSVASLTPQQAQAVIARLQEINRELAEQTRTRCHYCGLPLEGGACPEGCE